MKSGAAHCAANLPYPIREMARERFWQSCTIITAWQRKLIYLIFVFVGELSSAFGNFNSWGLGQLSPTGCQTVCCFNFIPTFFKAWLSLNMTVFRRLQSKNFDGLHGELKSPQLFLDDKYMTLHIGYRSINVPFRGKWTTQTNVATSLPNT